MAALIDGGAPRQPIHNGVDEEILNNIRELIVNRTGCPPVNVDHLYTFKQHVDNFPHPCPTVADSIVGGTFPTPNPPQPITQNLDGWADIDPQQQAFIQAIFNHISQEDQQHAYNHFFQKLRRAPRVLEFSRFLLIYEGQLYLENEEFRETLNRHLRSIELLEQMLSSKDIMIEVLGQSSTENMKKIDDLQTQKLNLQRILCTVQQDKAQLQLDHSSLRLEHTQCLTELEDERKDKQVFQDRCQQSQHRCQQLQTHNQALQEQNTQLQNKITEHTETITDMQVTIHEHEQNTDILTDMIRDLRQKLHRECSEKSDIYKQLMEKSDMISELEEDRALFMMENEAQGKYFLDLKEDKLKLQRENKELKEFVDKCRNILKAQYDKLISSMEVSLSRLEENLFLIKEENYKLSEVVTDLESKNSDLESKKSDLESKNSDLESKTSEQSVTISDLESKNSDLESKNSDLESRTSEQSVTISDLESKNSDLESKTLEQSITISELGSKNSDLESKNSDLESKNSDLESKNSDLESKTLEQSVTISELERKATTASAELQKQIQRQQFFILFLVALTFTLICLQFTSPGNNAHSTS